MLDVNSRSPATHPIVLKVSTLNDDNIIAIVAAMFSSHSWIHNNIIFLDVSDS